MSGRRRRPLSPEERHLWDRVARSAEPLRPADAPPPEAAALSADVVAPLQPPRAAPPPAALVAKPKPKPAPPGPSLTPIDRRTRSRLARGGLSLDGRLDLHGMTQAEAHGRLYGFLASVQTAGGKLVLVITGKGSLDLPGGDGGRGALRRAVPHWLSATEFRALVAGFESAHRTHGGDGALYVRLRRRIRR